MIYRPRHKVGIPEILLLAASILFMIGIRYWFPVCEVMSESIMPCHWAGEMEKAMSFFILILSLIHIVIPNIEVKLGMDISLAALFVLTVMIPGNIIKICGNAEMACRKSTHPFTILFCVVMIVLVFIDIVFCLSLRSDEKHKRKDERVLK